MAGSSHARNPEATATILPFSVAILLSVMAVAASPSKAPPLYATGKATEACVKLVFDPPAQAPPPLERVLCVDLLREIAINFRITGKLLPAYLNSLRKLPQFKNDPAALRQFICGLGPPDPAKFRCVSK